MKLVIITLLLAVAGISQANLQDDLKDFQTLIPKFKIGTIIAKHFLFDSEFRKFKNFMQSSEFKANCRILQDNNKVDEVQKYIEESGFNNFAAIPRILREQIEYSKKINIENMIISRSVMSFIDEVVNAFSKYDVTQMMKHKIQTSPDFRYFHERLSAAQFYELIKIARNDPEVVPVEKLFRSKGLNIDKLISIFKNILNWAN